MRLPVFRLDLSRKPGCNLLPVRNHLR